MSDGNPCPNCGTAVPAGAAFCTSCGTKLAAEAPPAPVAPADVAAPDAPTAWAPPAEPAAPGGYGDDATRVDNPGLTDSTQVLPTADPVPAPAVAPDPEPAPWATPPTAAAEPAPWAAAAAPAAPAAPAPAAWEQPPAAPAPTAWQQPPSANDPAAWGAPPPATAPPSGQWGPAPGTSTSGPSGGSPLGGIVGVIGGILVILGLFLAWIGPKGGDSLSGWELATKDKAQTILTSKDPYLLLGLGIAAVVIAALLAAKKAGLLRVIVAVLGLVVIGVHVKDYLDIKDVVKKTLPSSVTINFQVGFWLGIAGGAVLVVAALLPSKKKA